MNNLPATKKLQNDLQNSFLGVRSWKNNFVAKKREFTQKHIQNLKFLFLFSSNVLQAL